jgi:hypothetical protein
MHSFSRDEWPLIDDSKKISNQDHESDEKVGTQL